jgi:hypothetical protein
VFKGTHKFIYILYFCFKEEVAWNNHGHQQENSEEKPINYQRAPKWRCKVPKRPPDDVNGINVIKKLINEEN